MIKPENTSRKLDTLGRITLPKSLRNRMSLKTDDEVEFFTMEHNGREYICIAKAAIVDPKYLLAKSVLEELGFNPPEELITLCEGGNNVTDDKRE
jgi:bifunctional DNA-binding transcriptional regulator/antitoxin component of YhaV-PrlF toxin-antitoxin module